MMRIVSLLGTQDIEGGESHFSMVVDAGGESYDIPIGFDTYQLLNELAVVLREQSSTPTQPRVQEQQVFAPPTPEWEDPNEPEPDLDENPAERLQKIGLFEPQSVIDAVQSQVISSENELFAVLEDTSEEDEEGDPGEMNIDDGVGQYPGD